MLTIQFGESTYEFDLDEQLKTLTGTESMLVEEFIGGWERFRDPAHMTRSTIVLVWLAKRSAGEVATFDEIAGTPGLIFGDALTLTDDGDAPSNPDEDTPAGPLAPSVSLNGSSDGTTVSEHGPETSDSTGVPR